MVDFSLRLFSAKTIGVVIVASFAMLAWALAAPSVFACSCEDTYDSSDSIPSGYGAAYNVWDPQSESFITTSCDGSPETYTTTITVGTDDLPPAPPALTNLTGAAYLAQATKPTTQYVYNQLYVWNGSSWTTVPLQSSHSLIDGRWYNGKATATLTGHNGVEGQLTFVAGFTCSLVNNQWKCGCRDAACTQAYWQLQAALLHP